MNSLRHGNVVLVVITSIAGWLRLRGLGDRSLWLDEILHFEIATTAARNRWYEWLIGFELENGPLFYALQLLGRVLSYDVETGARLLPAVAGTAAVALICVAAGGRLRIWSAAAAAILLATSPLHVYYSREARPYALMATGTILLLIALLRRTRAPHVTAAAGALVLAYSAASSLPILASFLLAAVVLAVRKRQDRKTFTTIAAILVSSILWCRVLYPGSPNIAAAVGMEVSRHLARSVAVALSSSALERGGSFVYLFLSLFFIGLFAMLRRRQDDSLSLILLTGPGCLLLTIAALVHLDHWFAPRYIVNALPAFVLGAAAGVAALTEWARRVGSKTAVVTFVVFALACAIPGRRAAFESLEKLQWELIASNVALRARPSDVVIATNDWSAVCLQFYLRRAGSRLHVRSASESLAAFQTLLSNSPEAWVVSAGFQANEEIVPILGAHPPLLSSPIEDFRLYFLPSPARFLSSRALREDKIGVATSWRDRTRIEMRHEEGSLLPYGFHGVEHAGANDFRWSGRTSSVMIPTLLPAAIHARILPIDVSRQLLRVHAGDQELAAIELRPDWTTYELGTVIPKDGIAELTFHFSEERSSAGDVRRLSGAFDWISASPIAASAAYAPPVRMTLVGSNGERVDRSELGWRRVKESSGWKGMPLATRERIASALGFQAGPRGAVSLAEMLLFHVAETARMSDVDYVRVTYRLLLDREADERGLQVYVESLRKRSRHDIARSLLRAASRGR